MLFASRVGILVWLGLSVVVGGFLISATGTNTEGGTIAVIAVVGILTLPIAVWALKKARNRY